MSFKSTFSTGSSLALSKSIRFAPSPINLYCFLAFNIRFKLEDLGKNPFIFVHAKLNKDIDPSNYEDPYEYYADLANEYRSMYSHEHRKEEKEYWKLF